MHPSFSVLLFTTRSGAGYGIWAWIGLLAAGGALPTRTPTLLALALGFVLVTAGLLSSVGHLGQPTRAWRAFSQWRSSWLSREGIAALLCYLPALGLGVALWRGASPVIPGALLLVLSVATTACTAMIYASLKPVPAWRHPLVVPVYLLFSAYTGGLLVAALFGLSGAPVHNLAGLGTLLAAFLLWRMKRNTWRAIDTDALPVTRNSALGLPADRKISVFERPHTEANYLTREMGFVVARKHAKRLRLIALLAFALAPALLAMPVYLFVHIDAGPWMLAAALLAMLGALVERWLFFAEAKHLVTLYY
jgi:DMSO reductase anchor subunit